MLRIFKRYLATRPASPRGIKRLSLAEQGFTGVNARVGGFKVEAITYIQEFDVTIVQLKHLRTEASFCHIDTDDTNNAFTVTFRTPAKESTGLTHILEHVLCGSQKYPVRDPFFKMIKRSMNTYMNAMTTQYYTSYPFSTVVEQDYHNLLDVYLDATFFPLLRKTDFMQEGHRLEVALPAEGDSSQRKLSRTGVVFNEMKGALSDSASLFTTKLQREIYGNTSLGHCYGGYPPEIPNLTHEHLVEFHKETYHPSNACFFTYGDLPLINTLEKMENNVLRRFEFNARYKYNPILDIKISKPDATIKLKEVEMFVPSEKEEFIISRSWSIPHNKFNATDHYECTVASILSSLLIDGPQSPVYASLIDSQIAPRFSPGTGFDGSNYYPTFTLGAQGTKDISQAELAIQSGLEKAAEEGFPQSRIDALIHQMELSIRHKRADFGLSCINHASAAWVNGDDKHIPETFKTTDVIEMLKANSSPQYWKNLVKEYVLEGWNNYMVRLIAKPSATIAKEETEREEEQLKQLNEKLLGEDVERIVKENEMLAKERTNPEDISVLPTLDVATDVPLVSPEAVKIAMDVGERSRREIQRVLDQRTNGVNYLRLFFDASFITNNPELTALLPLMCAGLGKVDAGSRNYRELDLALESTAGSLSISPTLTTWLGPDPPTLQSDSRVEGIVVSMDCLTRNANKAYADVLGDIITLSNFSTDNGRRLQTLFATRAQGLVTHLPQSSNGYARLLSRTPHGRLFELQEKSRGLTYYRLMQGVHAAQLAGSQKVGETLQMIASAVFSSLSNPKASFVDTHPDSKEAIDLLLNRVVQSNYQMKSHLLQPLLNSLRELQVTTNGGGVVPKSNPPPPPSQALYLSVDMQIHYCHANVRTNVLHGAKDDAAMKILSVLARNDYLHQHVRERGGAYGAGCSFDEHGIFSFSSYWDPNSLQTIENYNNCLKWLCDGNFTEKQIDEALLGVFSAMDAPLSPSEKGMEYFLQGYTKEMKDAKREKYFDLVGRNGISKLKDCAIEHLSKKVDAFIHLSDKDASICIAGPAESLKHFPQYTVLLPNPGPPNVAKHQPILVENSI